MRNKLLAALLIVMASVVGYVSADERMSYIYKRGDRSYIRVTDAALDDVKTIARKYGAEFIWVNRDGRRYVISDAATLAEVREAFRAVDALEPELRSAEKKLRPYEKKLESIEERHDAISDQLDDERLSDAKRDSLEDRMRDIEDEMRAIEREMRGVEREMERVEKRAEALEEVAERRFEAIIERAIDRGIAERLR